jgi:SAM-dependent methyltransferase
LRIGNLMPERLYRGDPLTPDECEELEEDLISFCERELDLLGDVRGLDILYAGGSSLLWLEGLSQRVGEGGSVTALDIHEKNLERTRERLGEAGLASPVRLAFGDVFEPPFEPRTFDLVYSAGLFHELDVREKTAEDALAALASVVRPGGRVATSDFVDSVPAVQCEDEEIQRRLGREVSDVRPYGIGPPRRLVGLHERYLRDVRWRVSLPYELRHLGKLILTEKEPDDLSLLPPDTRERLQERRETFLERVRREGYTRPATLYVAGLVPGG